MFYFRIYAVFHRNLRIIWFFRIAWVVVLVACIIITFLTDNEEIASTGYCKTIVTSKAAVEVAIIQGSYDMLVCTAITYGLSIGEGQQQFSWKNLFQFRPRAFRHLRERFLQDSQLYFV